MLAGSLLERGFDGKYLRQAASLFRPTHADLDEVMPLLFQDVDFAKSTTPVEARSKITTFIAGEVLAKRLDPLIGADRVAVLFDWESEEDGRVTQIIEVSYRKTRNALAEADLRQTILQLFADLVKAP